MAASVDFFPHTWREYDAIRAPEQTVDGAAWKVLVIGGIRLTVFAPRQTRYEDSIGKKGWT